MHIRTRVYAHAHTHTRIRAYAHGHTHMRIRTRKYRPTLCTHRGKKNEESMNNKKKHSVYMRVRLESL